MNTQNATATIFLGLVCITATQAAHGAGNAHGAATAGMTYQGDPVSGPTSPWPVQTRMEPTTQHDGAGSGRDPSAKHVAPEDKRQ